MHRPRVSFDFNCQRGHRCPDAAKNGLVQVDNGRKLKNPTLYAVVGDILRYKYLFFPTFQNVVFVEGRSSGADPNFVIWKW